MVDAGVRQDAVFKIAISRHVVQRQVRVESLLSFLPTLLAFEPSLLNLLAYSTADTGRGPGPRDGPSLRKP